MSQSIEHNLSLRSATPGRERWNVKGLIRQATLAEEIENLLHQKKDIIHVKANALTGRVLVQFEPLTYQHGVGELINSVLDGAFQNAAAKRVRRRRGDQAEPKTGLKVIRDLTLSIDTEAHGDSKKTLYAVGSALAQLITPLILGNIMSIVLTGPIGVLKQFGLKTAMSQLWAVGAGFLGFKWIESTLEQKSKKEWNRYATEIENELRVKAFNKLEYLDMAYLEKHTTGQLRGIVHEDTTQVRKFYDIIPHTSIEKGITFGLGGAFLLAVSPLAFVLSLAPLPLCYVLFKRHRKNLTESYKAQREKESQLGHQITNSLGGLATIKSYTTEGLELDRLSLSSDELKDLARIANNQNSKYINAIRYSVTAGISLPLLYTGTLVLGGAVSMSAFIALVFLLPRLMTSMTGLDVDYDLYMNTASAARRLQKILDVPPEVDNGTQHLPAEQAKGELLFDDVSFGYLADQFIFENFSLQIEPGSTVAFVGTTGAGKSTLIKLLLRFYDTNTGRILLDGHDIHDIQLQDLRQTIAFVSQDVFLFQGSIYDNILYGRPDAEFHEVYEAARTAQLLDFINESPHGFDSQIHERGLNLSGGQKQRISIARAVLKNAPILILDEATSSVDNETEADIQKAVNTLLADRTVIIIAHRLSTVRQADCINVIDGGRIAESGKHEDLLALEGAYSSLWRLQTGET